MSTTDQTDPPAADDQPLELQPTFKPQIFPTTTQTDSKDGQYPNIQSGELVSQAHFDCTNLSMFFSSLPANTKNSSDPHPESKKRPGDSGLSKESSGKPNTSKDFSNLDELCQDTTILSNATDGKGHHKRVSNDVSISKIQSEDSSDISNCFS